MSTPIPNCKPANLSAVALPPIWGWDGWYVLTTIIVMFLFLFFEVMRTEFAVLGALMMIMAAQIITVTEALAGFGNSGVLAVTTLYVVAEGLYATGAVNYFMGKLLGTPKTTGQALIRMMFPVTALSAFLNNTPIVALMIPVLAQWCRKVKIAPSLIMMPLSIASQLGGTITLIGTSTNLVVSGRAAQVYCQQLGIFSISHVGLPYAIFGIAWVILMGPYMLPGPKEYARRQELKRSARGRQTAHKKPLAVRFFNSILNCVRGTRQNVEDDGEYSKLLVVEGAGVPEGQARELKIEPKESDYFLHAIVPSNSGLVGQTITEAQLRGLEEFFLVSVQRGNTLYSAVGPDFVLEADDLLSFAGSASNFLTLISAKGLTPVAVDNEGDGFMTIAHDPIAGLTIQTIVRAGSDLIGKTPKDVNFRTTYGAAILSIYRAGERLHEPRLGQVPLKIGDVLVCVTRNSFDWSSPATKRDLKPFIASDHANILPNEDRGVAVPHLDDVEREFFIPMRVAKSPFFVVRPLAGVTVEAAGFRALPGLYLFAIQRKGQVLVAVGPEEVIEFDDILWFTGEREGLNTLRRIPGLEDPDLSHIRKLNIAPQNRRLVEVVLSLRSDLLGKTVKESRFRSRYGAAIVAVHRRGERLLTSIGDIVFQPDDVLLLDTGPIFVGRYRDDPNFLLVSEIEGSAPPRFDKFYIAAITGILMVVMAAVFPTEVNMVTAALFAAAIMLVTGCLSGERAHRSVSWAVIITVASAFGLSTALEKSRVAGIFGNALVSLSIVTGSGEAGLLICLLVGTSILSAIVTNNAAALLMFPIGAQAAATMRIAPLRMLIAIMLGASDFTTPMGYQCNLMVMEPGGYVFSDYPKFGGTFELLLIFVAAAILILDDLWYIVLLVALAFLTVVIIFDLTFRGGRPFRDVICCRGSRSKSSKEDTPTTSPSEEPSGRQVDLA